MKIKVYEDRYLVEDKNISASQYENLATTLEFEFPDFIKKDGIEIPTKDLNKYIVFDIEQEENQDIIVNNKYSIPYEIAKLSEVTFIIKITEASEEIYVSNKLIWNSRKFTIYFNEAFEGHTTITSEKIDAFNTAVTALNQKTIEVDNTIKTVETKVEEGEFDGADGKDGITPHIKDGYWYIGNENTNVRAEGLNGKDGLNGADVKDYIITDADKEEIANSIRSDLSKDYVSQDDFKDTIGDITFVLDTINGEVI